MLNKEVLIMKCSTKKCGAKKSGAKKSAKKTRKCGK